MARPPHKTGSLPLVPKSILKQTVSAAPPNAPSSASTVQTREQKNRALALHHATLIQQRKDIEQTIFLSICTLLDFPPHPIPPSTPHPSDVSTLSSLIHPFQPSDFDSLIEERNIDGKCGYALCPRPHRKEAGVGKYKVIRGQGKGADGMKIVERGELEKWCSDECARDALYLRVQMSERPAWERGGLEGQERIKIWSERHGHEEKKEEEEEREEEENDDDIDDDDEDDEDDDDDMDDVESEALGSRNGPRGPARKADVENLAENLNLLALERGDKSKDAFRATSMQIPIRERTNIDHRRVQVPNTGGHHSAIDGYVPKSKGKQKQKVQFQRKNGDYDDEDDDMMDTI